MNEQVCFIEWSMRALRFAFLGVLFCLILTLTSPGNAQVVLLGDQSIEPSVDSDAAGTAEAFQTTASTSGTAASLTVYLDSTSTASKVYVGLYADNNGHPGALLAQASSTALLRGAWNNFPMSAATVAASVRYWIAILGTGTGKPVFRDRSNGSCKSETSSQTALALLPATWSTGAGYTDCPLSAYASSGVSSTPVLSISPQNIAFTASTGGAVPSPVNVNVTNTGGGTLAFTAASDSSWLIATPTSGTAPATVQISVSTSGLALGTYAGQVTFTSSGATGSPATVHVSLTVAKAADWPMVDHDSSRTGNAVDEATITPANVGNLQMNWSIPVDGSVTAQPLFLSGVQVSGQTHDVVIAATSGNSIYTLDATTGSTLWKRNFGSQPGNCAIPGGFGVIGAPLADRITGRIYTVSNDGNFHALSVSDGSDAVSPLTFVTNPATNKVWGGLNKVGNSVYVVTASDGCDTAPWRGQIYRIDVSATPTLASSFVVVPSIAFPNGGGGIWGYGGVSADPATGQIYAASGADSKETYTPYGNRMIDLDANLNLLGSFGPPEPNSFPCSGAPCDLDFGATPVVFQPSGCTTLVAAGNKNGNLYVFKATDLAASAQPLQVLTLSPANDWLGSGGVGGVPAYWQAGNMLFVTDAGPGVNGILGGVVGLNITQSCTLQVAWSTSLGGNTQPNSTPTVANGVVFVGEGATGMVHAYSANTGTELWNSGTTSYTAGSTYAAPIVAQGNVYVGSWSSTSGLGVVGAFSLNSTSQVLSVSPTNIAFSAVQGGSNPSSQTISVTNSGTGVLNFTAASDSAWLTVSPSSGTAPQTLQIGAHIGGLTQGSYTGHITVTALGAKGSPTTVTVTLTISATQPILVVTPTTLTFNAIRGGSNPPSQTVSLSNAGTGALGFTGSSDSTWLTVLPTSGTAPQTLQITANITGLSAGTVTGHVTVTASGAQGSPATITVTLNITTAGAVLFGDQSIELQRDSNSRGTAEAFQTTASVSGTLGSIVVFVDSSSTATTVSMGLYKDNNDHPGALVTQGNATQLTPGAWNTIAVSPAGITAGTNYWIAILGTGSGTPFFRDRARGSCKSESSLQTALTSLPATWSSGGLYSDCPISAYGH
jgi:outer membrane protein assembly factor BamB